MITSSSLKQRLRTHPKSHASVHTCIVTCGKICQIAVYMCVCKLILKPTYWTKTRNTNQEKNTHTYLVSIILSSSKFNVNVFFLRIFHLKNHHLFWMTERSKNVYCNILHIGAPIERRFRQNWDKSKWPPKKQHSKLEYLMKGQQFYTTQRTKSLFYIKI